MARASHGLCRALGGSDRLLEALPIGEAAAADIADLAPHRVLVELWIWLASAHSQLGDQAASLAAADRALADAERLRLTDLVVDGMQIKGERLHGSSGGRSRGAPSSKRRSALPSGSGAGPLTARAAFTLSLALFDEDPHAAVEMGRRTVELCRRFGLAHAPAR